MAHGKGSTGNSSDLPEVGKWQPLRRRYEPQHHSEIHCGESKVIKGIIKHRVWYPSKERAAESVASGSWPRSTTPLRRGWQSKHWTGVFKNYAIALEGNTILYVNVGGARRSHYLRVCVCVSVFGHKAACVFELVFSAFLIT